MLAEAIGVKKRQRILYIMIMPPAIGQALEVFLTIFARYPNAYLKINKKLAFYEE